MVDVPAVGKTAPPTKSTNPVADRMLKSLGPMSVVFEYLDKKESTVHQQLSKYFYEWLMPRAGGVNIKLPQFDLVFESQRKVISIG